MNKNISIGIAWIILGLIITLGSKFIMEMLAMASGSSYYVYLIAIGPFLAGGIRILSGIEEIIDDRKRRRPGYKEREEKKKTYIKNEENKLHWSVKLPYEVVIAKRKIRLQISILIIVIIGFLSLIALDYKIMYLAIIPAVYAIINFITMRDEVASNKNFIDQRKRMDETLLAEEQNNDRSDDATQTIIENGNNVSQPSSYSRKRKSRESLYSSILIVIIGIVCVFFSYSTTNWSSHPSNYFYYGMAFGIMMTIGGIIKIIQFARKS